jgi:hypothetical protein
LNEKTIKRNKTKYQGRTCDIQTCGIRKNNPSGEYCVVLNMEKNTCYVDYCKVPDYEKEAMLVK